MIYDKHTEKLIRIQFREMLCSIDSAQKWLNAKRKKPAPKIVTEFVNPPIPLRHFDWSAHFEGYEPGDPLGHGATKADAIAALREALL